MTIRYRGVYDIYADILLSLQEGPKRQSQLATKANLSYENVVERLHSLEKLEMIQKVPPEMLEGRTKNTIVWDITYKGRQAISKLKETLLLFAA